MRNHFSTLNLFDGGVVDLGVHFDCNGGTYILGKTIRVLYGRSCRYLTKRLDVLQLRILSVNS